MKPEVRRVIDFLQVPMFSDSVNIRLTASLSFSKELLEHIDGRYMKEKLRELRFKLLNNIDDAIILCESEGVKILENYTKNEQ